MNNAARLLLVLIGIGGVIIAQSGSNDDAVSNSPSPATPSSEQPASAEAAKFTSVAEVREHFAPLYGALATAWEEFERKPERDEQTFEQLRARERELVKAEQAALKTYLTVNDEAGDAIEARQGLVMLAGRLGDWENVVTEADAFLAKHKKDNPDMARTVEISRADALLNIEGREAEAAKALETIVDAYPGTYEDRVARSRLVIAYNYLNRIEDAKKIILQTLKLKDVEGDEGAQAFFNHELFKLNKVGGRFPDFAAQKPDGTGVSRADFLTKPLLIWYWESQGGTSLAALPAVAKIARDNKEVLSVVALSVDSRRDTWKQEAERLSADDNAIIHLYEGATGPNRSAKELMKEMPMPMTVLVNTDGTIHRLDVPSFDLERTMKLWLKK